MVSCQRGARARRAARMEAGGWHRVDPEDVPGEGRVRSVTAGGRTVALARCGGRLGALENRCPHQGGPLGEGSIEKGWLRCPWHGYDYDPLTGRPPGGFSDGVAGRLARPGESELARAVEVIRASRRPVLIVGHGARQATEQVRALAERLSAPVLTTFKAKGLIPDTHPLGAGVLGRSGTPVASWLMNEADLLIVVGASFANHTGIAPYKTILQIDDEPSAVGRFDPVSASITGDAALTLTA